MSEVGASRPQFPIADRPAVAQPAVEASAPTVADGATRGVMVTPGQDVPQARSETRARIGPTTAPMVEIDGNGSVHFVGGDWFSLTGFTKPGAAPLKAFASRTAHADQLSTAIAAAINEGTPSVFDFDDPAGAGRTHLKVLPIPSPIVGGQMHALVGLSDSSDLGFRQARPSAARYRLAEQ